MDPASIALVPNRVAGPLRASDLTSKMAPRLAPKLEASRDWERRFPPMVSCRWSP